MAERERRDAHDWLELVERSGLVIGEVPLHRHFPDSPGSVDAALLRLLVGRWERYRVDPEDATRRRVWDATVLHDVLDYPPERLLTGNALPEACRVRLEDVDEALEPWGVIADGSGGILLGIWRVPAGQGLDRVERRPGRWRATPQAKAERWMRGASVRIALLSNGSRFRLIHVPPGLPAGWMEFDAGQWQDERQTLAAFRLLLGWERVSGKAQPDLTGLLEESEKEQTELTDRLGEQVRHAVEDLLLALDRADAHAGDEVLKRIPESSLYEAAVFVVMRLVFLLFAEERSLLPHGNVFYDEAYGVGRLLHRLQEERRQNPDTFARESDGWPRLLALFRLVFHGSTHPDLNLPAYGGDLFDPQGSHPMAVLEDPRLKLPNQDIYEVLRSLTLGEAKVGREKLAQRFSYRTLDVEHIGYVYEGLLDHKAARAGAQPMVKLRNGSEQAWDLTVLEDKNEESLVRFLKDEKTLSGNEDRIRRALVEPDEDELERLRGLSAETARRCSPFAGVIQVDEVAEPGRLFLTTASSRRATGTHYTPIQYTRAMVQETLDPLVYVGEDGKMEEPLRLRSPRELLSLKVGDPAMGSGAFLVQVVRYLGEKLTDAWYASRDEAGEGVPLYLPYAEPGKDREDRIPLPAEREEAETWARRFVAERCVYGVDKNALAVEMAKLSVWLVTLSRDKPFSFLDHALRSGDSLVGISNLDQLRRWSLDGEGEDQVFAEFTTKAVEEATRLRKELEAFPVTDPSDVHTKRRLLAAADKETDKVRVLGDLLVAPYLASSQPARQQELLDEGLFEGTHHLSDPVRLRRKAEGMLVDTRPFHWPVEFPEVFEHGGFDAVLGNPPYKGNRKLRGDLGETYSGYLMAVAGQGRGAADLACYFLLRAVESLACPGGCVGLVVTNSLSEGTNEEVGLRHLRANGQTLYSAHANEPWPRDASVFTHRLHLFRGRWSGPKYLDGREVEDISSTLKAYIQGAVERLKANKLLVFQGSVVLGDGFFLEESEAHRLSNLGEQYEQVLCPYLDADDLTSASGGRRWIISTWDWPWSRVEELPEIAERLRRLVYPGRVTKNDEDSYRGIIKTWWRYWRPRRELYHQAGRGDVWESHPDGWGDQEVSLGRVIVASTGASKYFTPVFVPNEFLYSHALVVFPSSDDAVLALLSSSVHVEWAWEHSSKMKRDIRYTPTKCFETFPLPTHGTFPQDGRLEECGLALTTTRSSIMLREGIGLTDLYNRLHDPNDTTEDLDRLRDLQVAIDARVLEIYGWSDIPLNHDFRDVPYLPENDRHRFAICEEARLEILNRLGRLNRERHEEEVRAAEAEKAASKGKKGRKKPKEAAEAAIVDLAEARQKRDAEQPTLFDQPDAPLMKVAETNGPPAEPLSPGDAILQWLSANPGWHGRAQIVEAAGVSQGDWNGAINALQEQGQVERQGEKRGSKYRAVGAGEEDGG